jgi:two-component system nitrate/nitrite response regulator NarL
MMLTGTEGYANRETPSEFGRVGQVRPNDARPEAGQVRVLLAGGSCLLQESVIRLLDGSAFSVDGCVADIEDAIRVVEEDGGAFDLLIVQLLGFSDVRFFDRLARLRQRARHCRIVLLAWPEKDVSFLAGCVEAGADAYLESSLTQEGFRRSLDRVVAGTRIFPSRIQHASRWETGVADESAADPGPGAALSRREIEILRHLANGEPNKVIAKALDITEATVKVHVKGILRKTGAPNRTSAAIWAIQNGLTPAVRGSGF